MPFLGHHDQPLTERHIHAILSAAACIPRYRFSHLHAVDQVGNEYHVCHADQLATLNVREFRGVFAEALSYRLGS